MISLIVVALVAALAVADRGLSRLSVVAVLREWLTGVSSGTIPQC